MSGAPKIAAVHHTLARGWNVLYDNGARMEWNSDDGLLADLADRRQSLDIPADVGPGWLGIPTDLPAPEPLPDLEMWCYRKGDMPRWWSMIGPGECRGSYQLLATLTVRTDPATGEPVATVERVAS